MGARARGSRANGLGCESGEGFVERLACGLPEEELARHWPVSQSALQRWAVVGEWWAGQRRASLCRSGWVQRSVGIVACLAVRLGRRRELRCRCRNGAATGVERQPDGCAWLARAPFVGPPCNFAARCQWSPSGCWLLEAL